MPFDGHSHTSPDHARDQAIALAQQHRATAVAFWRTIADESVNMGQWCGTRACALGWLAQRNVDGWYVCRWVDKGFPSRRDLFTYQAALAYFGLSFDDATTLFRPFQPSSLPHVSRALLALPIRPNAILQAEAQQEIETD